EQRFREDLFYRLSEVSITLPPLRDRPGDAVVMAHAFLGRYGAGQGTPRRGFTPEAIAAIQAYAWPGNVRELENKVKTAVIMAEGPLVTAEDLALANAPGDGMLFNLKEVRARAERQAILQTLALGDGKVSR